ncbi:MAG: DegT/DnrJ/EryC1/StrS family aminotransferase, partial [bacterium]
VTETYRKTFIGNIVHKVLISLKGKRSSYTSVRGQLKKISRWQLKISAIQISRLPKLHQKRKSIGKFYYNKLKESGFLINSNYDPDNSSFTKFFLYNPKIETKKDLKNFHNLGIEAMHLEHKQGSPYQEMLISKKEATAENLIRYQKVHDSVISIPSDENFSTEDLQFILERIQK